MFPCALGCQSPATIPRPLATAEMLSITIALPLLEVHINGTIKDVVSYVWAFHLA